MPTVRFTRNIQRHVECPTEEVAGTRCRRRSSRYFALAWPRARLRAGRLRPAAPAHGRLHRRPADRGSDRLSDPLDADAVIDIVQALSGG